MVESIVVTQLKLVRKSMKMSIESFSKFLGVPPKTYQHWEYGTRHPSFNAMVKVADKLCVSLDWLAGRENVFILHNLSDKEIKKIFKVLHEEK